MNFSQINQLGQTFYQAFNSIELSDAPGFLPHFPEGCCSWSTWMIGHYLKFECGLEPKEVQGTRSGGNGSDNHAWVTVDGIIVDLTCGQYKDCPQPFIISDDSIWHSKWTVVNINDIRHIVFHNSARIAGKALPSEIYVRIANNVRSQCA